MNKKEYESQFNQYSFGCFDSNDILNFVGSNQIHKKMLNLIAKDIYDAYHQNILQLIDSYCFEDITYEKIVLLVRNNNYLNSHFFYPNNYENYNEQSTFINKLKIVLVDFFVHFPSEAYFLNQKVKQLQVLNKNTNEKNELLFNKIKKNRQILLELLKNQNLQKKFYKKIYYIFENELLTSHYAQTLDNTYRNGKFLYNKHIKNSIFEKYYNKLQEIVDFDEVSENDKKSLFLAGNSIFSFLFYENSKINDFDFFSKDLNVVIKVFENIKKSIALQCKASLTYENHTDEYKNMIENDKNKLSIIDSLEIKNINNEIKFYDKNNLAMGPFLYILKKVLLRLKNNKEIMIDKIIITNSAISFVVENEYNNNDDLFHIPIQICFKSCPNNPYKTIKNFDFIHVKSYIDFTAKKMVVPFLTKNVWEKAYKLKICENSQHLNKMVDVIFDCKIENNFLRTLNRILKMKKNNIFSIPQMLYVKLITEIACMNDETFIDWMQNIQKTEFYIDELYYSSNQDNDIKSLKMMYNIKSKKELLDVIKKIHDEDLKKIANKNLKQMSIGDFLNAKNEPDNFTDKDIPF